MSNIIVLSKREPCPEGYISIDTTSRNPDVTLKKGLSPFYLGPVSCYDGLTAANVENAWQYSKVYPKHLDEHGEPTDEYFVWRNQGFKKTFADRYPMGKGEIPKYSYWKVEDKYQKLDYIEARKELYVPLYAKAVVKTPAFEYLKSKVDNGDNIALIDFDGYNHESLGMSLFDVINCKSKKMGHAFVLSMLLQGKIIIKDDKVVDLDGLLQ
jgi:hypothetical protein